jgi:cell division protein FtsA
LGAVNEHWDRRRKPENVDLTTYMDEPYSVARRDLVQAIDARVEELLEMVVQELKKIDRHGRLPAGVVISGGGAKLPGFATLVRDTLGLPVRAAKPVSVQAFDAALDPALSVALGLVAWGWQHEGSHLGRPTMINPTVDGWLSRAAQWLKNFLP